MYPEVTILEWVFSRKYPLEGIAFGEHSLRGRSSLCHISSCGVFFFNFFHASQAALFQTPRQAVSSAIAPGLCQADLKVAYQLIDDGFCMPTSQFSSYSVSRPVKAIRFLLTGQSEEAGCQGI